MTSLVRTIIVVCRGNIARSPFAEAIINRELVKYQLTSRYRVLSCGVQGTTVDPTPVKHSNITFYERLYEDSKPVLVRFNVDLSHHKSRAIDTCAANEASIMLAMDYEVKAKLEKLFPEHRNKIHMFSELTGKRTEIKDPEVASEQTAQNHAFIEIADAIASGFPKLIAMAEGQ